MKMRPLIIDDGLRLRIARVIRYAANHHFIVGETWVPGDDPNHVLITDFGYRCVFSFTQASNSDVLFRDLSISVSERGKYPNPMAAFALATEFGFTGWRDRDGEMPPSDWMIQKDVVVEAVRIAQRI